MIVRKIFGPKREEIRGKWGKLHMEEFYNFYSSPGTRARSTDYQIKKSEMVGTFVSNGKRRGACRALTFKNRASYIQDGRTATLQMLHFIYFFNKYKY
jgi:hypothetical protein